MFNTKTIRLTKGAEAIISAEDYEMVSQYRWHITSNGYAARNNNERKRVYMHRVINCTPAGMHTDHRDGNKLRNTRENLRTVTKSQNAQNSRKAVTPKSSQFKGVHARSSYWKAALKVAGRTVNLGSYKTELDAAFAYNLRAKEQFGEFAALNVLPLDYLATHTEPERFCDRNYSRYRGVTWHIAMKKWLSYACAGGKRVHESYHETEQEAHAAYVAFKSTFREVMPTQAVGSPA